MRKHVKRLRETTDTDDPEVRILIEEGEALEMDLSKIKQMDLPDGVDPVEYVTRIQWTAAGFLEAQPEGFRPKSQWPWFWIVVGLFLGVPALLAIGATIASLL